MTVMLVVAIAVAWIALSYLQKPESVREDEGRLPPQPHPDWNPFRHTG